MTRRATVPVTPEAQASDAERAPDFLWSGRPVYRCRLCPYERVENLAAVLQHEGEHHQPPAARTSSILGQDGAPLKVTDGKGDHENE
jgi:hypothetical protein